MEKRLAFVLGLTSERNGETSPIKKYIRSKIKKICQQSAVEMSLHLYFSLIIF